jgi:hypothetical protein
MYTCNRLLLCEGLNCSTDAGIDTFVSLCQHVSKHIFGKNNCIDRVFIFFKQGQNLWPNRLMNGIVYKKIKARLHMGVLSQY